MLLLRKEVSRLLEGSKLSSDRAFLMYRAAVEAAGQGGESSQSSSDKEDQPKPPAKPAVVEDNSDKTPEELEDEDPPQVRC